jgi:hypothetical protein
MEIGGTVLEPRQVKTIFDEMTSAFLALSHQALRDVPDPHKPWTAKDAPAIASRCRSGSTGCRARS